MYYFEQKSAWYDLEVMEGLDEGDYYLIAGLLFAGAYLQGRSWGMATAAKPHFLKFKPDFWILKHPFFGSISPGAQPHFVSPPSYAPAHLTGGRYLDSQYFDIFME